MNAPARIDAAPAQSSSARPASALSARPVSAVGAGVGLAGLVGLGGWLVIARVFGLDGPSSALVACVACAAPMILWSLLVERVHERASTGLDLALRRPWSEVVDLTTTKLAGLWATWAVIAALYWIGRWYALGTYPWALGVLTAALPALVVLSVPYLLWIDRRMVDPRDGCWHAGAALTGRWSEVDRARLANHARSWTVKAFFLAFMLSILPGALGRIIDTPLAAMVDPVVLAGVLISAMFAVDVMFATAGYVLTFRPLDAHIRSAEPTVAGWVAALACYPPFALMFANRDYAGPLHYNAGSVAAEASWSAVFAGSTAVLWLVGAVLLVLTAFYAWATVAFGLRFSNLTHRGILTNGPYRFTRHPAYLSKNAFWWLATLPFLAADPADAVRNTALMALVSGVYYWRARTEERHLGRDPAYRDYFNWMEARGLWPRLTRPLLNRQPLSPRRSEGEV